MQRFFRCIAGLMAATVLSSCDPWSGDDGTSVAVEYVNETGMSLVLGMFVKSDIYANKAGLTKNDSRFGAYWFDVDKGEFLIDVDWQLASYMYTRHLWLYASDNGDIMAKNFREGLDYYGTDTLFIPVATSVYNLWRWVETSNPLYLHDLCVLPIEELGPQNNRYALSQKPTSTCCFRLDTSNLKTSLAVGLYFVSDTMGTLLGTEETEFLSIIGTSGLNPNLVCPLGYGDMQTFGEFFQRTGTSELTVLFAESEEKIMEWFETRNESLLFSRQVFTLENLGKGEREKHIYDQSP